LASAAAQSVAVAALLAIPLFHLERLQFIAPPPSIQMTAVEQAPSNQESGSGALAPPLPQHEILRVNRTASHIGASRASSAEAEPAAPGALACTPPCGAPGALTSIFRTGSPLVDIRPPHPARPLPVSEMQLGALVHKVIPIYPEIAKRARIQGTVLLSALIGKDGRVESVVPVSGPPMLVRAAEEAVRQWQYRPYVLNNEPVAVQTSITVHFTLNNE
jgi:protein TonB